MNNRFGYRGFTLIELMVVIAIMAMMGTLSVGGYRAMRQGMEERGVMQNASQFIRNAYQRATIDRVPTAVYFWNETRRLDTDDETLLVVGRAVAVRRAGRVSYIDGSTLVDEFGDLRFLAARENTGSGDEDEAGYDDDTAKKGMQMAIYKINGGNSIKRYTVSQSTVTAASQPIVPMMTDQELTEKLTGDELEVFGYYMAGGAGDWHAGDAYGFEFADITLPNNYIFGSSYSKSLSDPEQEVGTLMFDPAKGGSGGTIQISALRPGSSGDLVAKSIGTTVGVTENQSEVTE